MLVAKRDTNQESYMFRLANTRALTFGYSSSGTASTIVTSTNLVFGNGVTLWLRVTFDANNGAAGTTTRFYWSYDEDHEPFAWRQLGADVVTATAVTLFSGTALLEIGSRAAGTTEFASGNFHRVIVRNALIAGTTVFDADFTRQTAVSPASRKRPARRSPSTPTHRS